MVSNIFDYIIWSLDIDLLSIPYTDRIIPTIFVLIKKLDFKFNSSAERMNYLDRGATPWIARRGG